MIDSPALPLSTPLARIGVQGLPNLTDKMVAGGLYVLIAETPPARFPLLAANVRSVIQTLTACTIVVPTEPSNFLQRLGGFDETNYLDLIRAKKLAVFSTQEEFNKKIFQFGIEGFVQELEQFQVPEGGYLLFDQADELLSLHDVVMASGQIAALRDWCAGKEVTMLLVFSRCTEAHVETLNALMDHMTGLARLGADAEGLTLHFDYWQSDEGAIAARSFQLEPQGRGLYRASVKLSPTVSQESARNAAEPGHPLPAPPETPAYYYMDPDLGSLARQMAGNWRHVDTLVGMLHATRNAPYAVCILSFGRDTSVRQLAETAHTLRTTLGRHAKIIVQEKEASLRYQNEALLLRLGVNLVVNRNVTASRLPLLIESLSSQVFARDVEINFEAALASVLPTRLRGYLQPKAFAREAKTMLDQGDTLNIPSALIIGAPINGLTIEAVIASCGLSRPGDLVTGDTDRCYLFLNGCPESVMLSTLDRIFAQPANEILADVQFLVQRDAVSAELQSLALRAEKEHFPNYQASVSRASNQNDAQSTSTEPVSTHTPAVAATMVPLPSSGRSVLQPNRPGTLPTGAVHYNYGTASATRIFGRQVAPRATRSQVFSESRPAILQG